MKLKKIKKIKEKSNYSQINIKWKYLILPWLYKKRGTINRQVHIWMTKLNWD